MPPALTDSTLAQPWSLRTDEYVSPTGRGRPVLLVPADVDAAVLEATGERLPLVGQFTDPRRFEWRKFETPAPTRRDDRLRIRLERQDGSSVALSIRLPVDTAPQTAPLSVTPDDARRISARLAFPSTTGQLADVEAHRMTGLHLSLMHRLHESADAEGRMIWDAMGGGVAAWPVARVMDAWREVGRQTGPGPALIVTLARRLGPALQRVCMEPRSRLRRRRSLQAAARVQEMDATCLRWLARQPGVTVAERVGARQQAMGVTRYEVADSMENRLVRRLLDELIDEADRYMLEHADDPEHERVREVEGFRAEASWLRSNAPISRVPRLTGVPRPNNPLQRDPRYRPLFQAYVMLLEQRRQRDRVWRWRQRVWGESCQLAMMAALQRIVPNAAALRSNLLLRPEARCGRFIDGRSGIGRYDLIRGGNAYSLLLLDRQQFVHDGPPGVLPEQLGALCPDALLVIRDGQKPDNAAKLILGVWSVLDFDLQSDALRERCEQVACALRQIPTPTELRGLVLQPKLTAPPDDPDDPGQTTAAGCIQETRVRGCLGLRLSLPLQRHEALLATLLREELDLD